MQECTLAKRKRLLRSPVGSLDAWLDMRSCGTAARGSRLGDAGRCSYNASLQRADSHPAYIVPPVALTVWAPLPSLAAVSHDFSSGLCTEAALSHPEAGLKSRAVDVLPFGISDSEDDADAEDKAEEEDDEILSSYGISRSRRVVPCVQSSCSVLGAMSHADAGPGLVPTSVSGRYSSLRTRRNGGTVSSTGYVVIAPTGGRGAAAFVTSSPSSSAPYSSSDCTTGTGHNSLGSTLSISGMCNFIGTSTCTSPAAGAGTGEGYFDSLLRFADIADQRDQQPDLGFASLAAPRAAAVSARGFGSGSIDGGGSRTTAAAAVAACCDVPPPAFSPLGDSPSAVWLSRTAAKPRVPEPKHGSTVVVSMPHVSLTAFAPAVGCDGNTQQQQAAACVWPRVSEAGTHTTLGYGGYGGGSSSPMAAAATAPGATAAASPFTPLEEEAGCRTSAKSHGPYEGTMRGGRPRHAAGCALPLATANSKALSRVDACSGFGYHTTAATKRSAPMPVAASQQSPRMQQPLQQHARNPVAAASLAASPSQAKVRVRRSVTPKHLCDMLRLALQRR